MQWIKDGWRDICEEEFKDFVKAREEIERITDEEIAKLPDDLPLVDRSKAIARIANKAVKLNRRVDGLKSQMMFIEGTFDRMLYMYRYDHLPEFFMFHNAKMLVDNSDLSDNGKDHLRRKFAEMCVYAYTPLDCIPSMEDSKKIKDEVYRIMKEGL